MEEYFASHYAQSDVEVQSVPAADWHLYIDLPHGRYGWTVPFRDGGRLLLPHSPQIIDYQTKTFDVREVKEYLHAIVWICDRFKNVDVTTLTREEFNEAQARIESELYDLSPPALAVFSRIQLSVLDR